MKERREGKREEDEGKWERERKISPKEKEVK